MSKKVSEAYLERAALHYLGRFNSTEANLRAVLARKVRRRNEENAPPTSEQNGWIEAVAAKCVRLGYIDDQQYAAQRLASLRRKGKPVRVIVQDLRHKGAAPEIIATLVSELEDEAEGNPDKAAAAAYARRRRFGPFRRADKDTDEKREKEKAAMLRAGFSYSIVSEVLASSENELIALMP